MKHLWVIFAALTVFGEVTQEDWNLKADPEKGIEHAVILQETGLIDETYTYTMSKRNYEVKLKFLSKKGIEDHGTMVLTFNPPYENISGIEATVYLPDGKKIKLSKEDIHKKKISKEFGVKETEISLAFPGLVEGAIVEYKYSRSFNGLKSIYYWSFQGNLYCMKSEVRYIAWPKLPWGVSFSNSLGEPVINKGKYNLKPSVLISRTNIPPLKKEPFALPLKAQREAVWFFHKDELNSKGGFWEARGKQYYKQTLKKMLKPLKTLNASITVDPADPEAIQTIYNYVVSKHISFSTLSKEDEQHIDKKYIHKLTKANRITELLKMKYLYQDQLNYVLGVHIATLLPGANIEYVKYLPWNEGFFNANIKTLQQFTDSMLKVTHMGKTYWLSPIKRFLPVNQLPYGAYETQLLVMGKGGVYFEKLPVPDYKNSITKIELDFVLNEDADMATITRKRTLNPLSSYRKRSLYFYYEEKELEDRLLGALEKEFGRDTALEEFSVVNLKEIEKPLIIQEKFTVSIDLDEAGDYLLFKTIGLLDYKKNPFNKKNRKQPVVFAYPYQTEVTAVYHIGDAYVVPEVPKNVRINDTIYTYRMAYTKNDDHCFTVQTVVTLTRNLFNKDGGAFFRESINPMMKSTSQPVLIEESE